MDSIKCRLEQLVNSNSVADVEKITGNIGKLACGRMKAGKIDVTEA